MPAGDTPMPDAPVAQLEYDARQQVRAEKLQVHIPVTGLPLLPVSVVR